MAKVIPFSEHIVLEEYFLDNKTEGGILMPEKAMSRNIGTFIGRVMSVGKNIKIVKEGDIIVTHKGKLWQLPLMQKMYWLAKEDAIGALIELEEKDKEEPLEVF